MTNVNTEHYPDLQPPGRGLPRLELFMARLFVKVKLRTISKEENLRNFVREKEKILSLVEGLNPDLASRRVLIKRLRGLEDSSRFWSIYMTLEHLRIVNRAIIDVVTTLVHGNKPPFTASTAAVKPDPGISSSVLTQFKEVCEEFEDLLPGTMDLKTSVTFAHPWFGELNAEAWHFFAGFHMALHRVQITKILEELAKESPK